MPNTLGNFKLCWEKSSALILHFPFCLLRIYLRSLDCQKSLTPSRLAVRHFQIYGSLNPHEKQPARQTEAKWENRKIRIDFISAFALKTTTVAFRASLNLFQDSKTRMTNSGKTTK